MTSSATTSTTSTVDKKPLTQAEQDTTTEAERSQALATALYEIYRDNTFYCSMLQSMDITYSFMLDTAGVTFSADQKKYMLYINPMFFVKRLSQANRKAVLIHEIFHLCHRHLTRVPFFKVSNHNRKLLNIAADLAINAYIQDLPNGCSQCPPENDRPCTNEMCPGKALLAKDFYDEKPDGTKVPWPLQETMEQYFFRLKERYKEPDEGDGEVEGEGEGEGEGKGKGKGKGKGNGKGLPQEFDEHGWEANSEEGEMLDAMEELVKRAMIKSSTSYDRLPSMVAQLIEDIKSRKAELNYKALILSAIKKSASGQDRKYSWTRKSRRFPNLIPGSKEGPLPKLRIVCDTSGSIDIATLNSFLEIVDNFLKVGARKCSLHLFSDTEYYSQSYKMGDRIGQEMLRKNVRMGGTCVQDSLKNILKSNPDLSLILTDGFFSDVNVESWLKPNQRFPETLWVIEKQGSEEHPFAKRSWSKTVKVPK